MIDLLALLDSKYNEEHYQSITKISGKERLFYLRLSGLRPDYTTV